MMKSLRSLNFETGKQIMLKSIYTLAYLWFSPTMTLIPFSCNNPETLRSMISVYYLCSTVVDLYWGPYDPMILNHHIQ